MIALSFILALSLSAIGYVENVVHGYPNCMACHIAPSGGGVLNDYGRALSAELMSTHSLRGSEAPLFGLMQNTENLKIGGDIRYAQVHSETKERRRGRQFLMQQNVELAMKHREFWFVGSAGTQEGPREVEGRGQFLSERHYFMVETSETHRLRVGKFRKNFGLNDANHTRFTKSSFGFGSLSETYQLESTHLFSAGEGVFFADLGRLDLPRSPSEQGMGVTLTHYLAGKSRAGVMGFLAESPAQRREVLGAYGVLPLSQLLQLKSEIVGQKSYSVTAVGPAVSSLAGQYTMTASPWKGVNVYVLFEHFQSDLKDNDTLSLAPGIGALLLPFPHFDFQVEYQERHRRSQPDNPERRAWVVGHFYH